MARVVPGLALLLKKARRYKAKYIIRFGGSGIRGS
jgi:hypothetical protein